MSYDPFETGRLPVSVRTVQAADAARDRVSSCEIWSPVTDAGGGSVPLPLIVFSHSSGGNRTSAGYLCTHLASHGYVVAAMDHSETVAPALAPGGSSRPRPGILPLKLTFDRSREVPVLYLAAADDVCTPLDGVQELFRRTPEPTRMFVLSRADHLHFVDDVEREHEAFRAMTLPGDAAWIPGAMRPVSELCPGAQAHDFVRGLTLAHLDASLRQSQAAARFLATQADAALAARGVDAAADAGC